MRRNLARRLLRECRKSTMTTSSSRSKNTTKCCPARVKKNLRRSHRPTPRNLATGDAASNSFAALIRSFSQASACRGPKVRNLHSAMSASRSSACFCKADGFQADLALAKARRMASDPVPSASSPSIACFTPSAKRRDNAANSASSSSSKRSPARMASFTFRYRPEVTKPATKFS